MNSTTNPELKSTQPLTNPGNLLASLPGAIQAYYTSFLKSLDSKFEKCDLLREVPSHSTVRILDLGCGKAEPILSLAKIALKRGIRFHYFGVDINKKMIASNQAIFSALNNTLSQSKSGTIHFIAGDATQYKTLPMIGDLANQFDLILYRQPNVLAEFDVVKKLNEAIAYFLNRETGRVFFSCYTQHEFFLTHKMLNIQLPLGGLNQHSYWPSRLCMGDESFKITRTVENMDAISAENSTELYPEITPLDDKTLLYSPDCYYVSYTPRKLIEAFKASSLSTQRSGDGQITALILARLHDQHPNHPSFSREMRSQVNHEVTALQQFTQKSHAPSFWKRNRCRIASLAVAGIAVGVTLVSTGFLFKAR